MKKLFGGAGLAVVVVLAVAAVAFATSSSGFSTEQLSVGRFDEIDVKTERVPPAPRQGADQGDSDVYVVEEHRATSNTKN